MSFVLLSSYLRHLFINCEEARSIMISTLKGNNSTTKDGITWHLLVDIAQTILPTPLMIIVGYKKVIRTE